MKRSLKDEQLELWTLEPLRPAGSSFAGAPRPALRELGAACAPMPPDAASPAIQLFSPAEGKRLCRDLERLTKLTIDLTITNNASTVMSMKRCQQTGTVRLRLHHMFLRGDGSVVNALAAWIKRPKARPAGELLNQFIRNHRFLIEKKRVRQVQLLTRGRYHNLKKYYDEVNQRYFANTITAAITWGQRQGQRRRRRRSIRLGSYLASENLIRIHLNLDQEGVPGFFVRFIVFHEMLHAHLGIEETESGRRRIHTREFVSLERAHPDFERAQAWENDKANMRKLLR